MGRMMQLPPVEFILFATRDGGAGVRARWTRDGEQCEARTTAANPVAAIKSMFTALELQGVPIGKWNPFG